jgi:predicted GH43/DUF377 family glycosyl hydrolase
MEMSNTQFKELFIRHKANFIIQARGITYQPNSIFNVGADCFIDDTLLLMRVKDCREISPLTAAHDWDCITDWRTDPNPTLLAGASKYHGRKYGAKS